MVQDDAYASSLADLGELFSSIRRQWLLIGLVTFVCAAAATAIAFALPRIYRAEVLVTAADQDEGGGLAQLVGGLGGVAALAGLDLGGKTDVEVSLAMLRSHQFTAAFIEENQLAREFFWRKWDAGNQRWKSQDPDEVPTVSEAVLFFDKSVRSVSRDRRTGLIKVAVEWRDRRKAADWANELIRRVNQVARDKAIGEAERSIAYLNKELEKTKVVELQQAIYRLIETQINRIVLANVREEFAFRVIDPAVVPDAKYKVRPKRLLIMLAGAAIGGILGIAIAFVRAQRVVRRAATTNTGVARP